MKDHRFAVVVVLLTAAVAMGGIVPGMATGGPVEDGAGAGAGQSTVTLTVSVVDNFNSPISDARLTAFWDGGSSEARTASNGKAFLDVREGATVRIFVNSTGYTRNNPVVLEDASERDVTITVSRRAEARVSVVENGAPLDDARVRLFKEDRDRVAAEGTTGEDGVFASGTIEQGTYRVVAVKEGYLRNATTVEVRDTTDATVSLSQGTVSVTFTVQDDHFDPPRALGDAQIDIEGATSATLTTSSSGSRTIGLPVNARFEVEVTKEGYDTATRTIVVSEQSRELSFNITRADALTVETVNQRVVVGEKVQLSVTDEYGEPVANATVTVDGSAVGETNAEGIYRATIDSAGEHSIAARKDGVSAPEVTVTGVSAGGSTATATPAAGDTPSATPTPTDAPAQLPDLGQPGLPVKVGVAAVGVLLAFLVVRRLL